MKTSRISNNLAVLVLLTALPALTACGIQDEPLSYENGIQYGGSANHPIRVVNGKAVVNKCGNWDQDLVETNSNLMNPNHGCAVQKNMAAMIAKPGHIKHPPKLGPRNSALDVEAVTSTQSSGRRSGGFFSLFGG
jgi:type IV pilus biogenesis protein CpaD/CtpE